MKVLIFNKKIVIFWFTLLASFSSYSVENINGGFGYQFGQKVSTDKALGNSFNPSSSIANFDEYLFDTTYITQLVRNISAYKRDLSDCLFKDEVENKLDKKYLNFKKEVGLPHMKDAIVYMDYDRDLAILGCSKNKKNNTWTVSLLLLSDKLNKLGALEKMRLNKGK